MIRKKMVQTIRFYAISDFGAVNREIVAVASAMNRYATEMNKPPDFVCGLGDNFYPYGVENVLDEQFQTTWRDTFLRYPALRVPWRMVLGNHDYMWNPYAQIEYHHNKKLNRDGLWYMPDHIYQFQYKLDVPATSTPTESKTAAEGKSSNRSETDVDFFVYDTNACQGHVVRSFPQVPIAMKKQLSAFRENLIQSTSHWKIVFGHHPMYTQGLGHSGPALCLREKEYRSERSDKVYKGYGVERIFIEGKVDAYFTGHEHVFQYHQAHDIHHFCCGASGADMRPLSGLYDGPNPDFNIDWIARGDQYGFVCAEVSAEELVVKFLNHNCEILKEVVIRKPL